jgi:microcystin-dependent protein
MRGRVPAGKDDMGGSSAARLSVMSSTTLGAVGGAQTVALTLAQLPTGITSSNLAVMGLSVTSTTSGIIQGALTAGNSGTPLFGGATAAAVTSTGNIPIGDADVTSNNTSGSDHLNVQPTIICKYALRIF